MTMIMENPKPVTGMSKSLADIMNIVRHPAFRLGVLDFIAGRPFNHDEIIARINAETPAKAINPWEVSNERLAQYRYEEGRLAALIYKIKIRSWNWPNYPPKPIREMALQRAAEIAKELS